MPTDLVVVILLMKCMEGNASVGNNRNTPFVPSLVTQMVSAFEPTPGASRNSLLIKTFVTLRRVRTGMIRKGKSINNSDSRNDKNTCVFEIRLIRGDFHWFAIGST